MPRHEEWSPDESRRKKHKKHKHKYAGSDNDQTSQKKSKHKIRSPDLRPDSPEIPPKKLPRTRSPALSPDRHTSKNKLRKRDYQRSPDRPRIKEERKDRYSDDFSRRTDDSQDRRYHQNHRGIKQEEDFDRRQEELRERRREARSQGDRERWRSRPDRDFQDERRRNDDNRRKERERRDQAGATEEAFKESSSGSGDKDKKEEKEKPNLGLSGALTEDTNTFRGVVIKYNEPPEARKPKKKWRLYPFKGSEALKTLHLHRQSAFLLGRHRRIADIPIDHPSCSKQHAVLQFRMVEVEVDGTLRRRVKPYVIDLGSANGTFVNNQRIDPQRYVELKEQDVLKFGFSSREYVLLHDKSDTGDVEIGSESEEED